MLNGIVGYVKKKKKLLPQLEQSSIVIRTNVAGCNAYVNEPVRLPDRDGECRDDVEVIETSRPDTKKAEEEKYRIIVVMHIVSMFLTPDYFFPRKTSPVEGGSRGRTCTPAPGVPPTCGAPETPRDIATKTTF